MRYQALFESLRLGAPDWGVLHGYFLSQLSAAGVRDQDRVELAQDLVVVLLEMQSGDRSPEMQHPAAYLRTMVRHAVERRGRQRPEHSELDEKIQAEEQVDLAQEWAQSQALLTRVVQHTAATRRPRYRQDLLGTWKQILDNAVGAVSLRQLIAQQPDAEQDWRRAANRVYKRHQRLRQELLDAIESMGGLDENPLDLQQQLWAQELLQSMRYCQKSMARGSYRGEE